MKKAIGLLVLCLISLLALSGIASALPVDFTVEVEGTELSETAVNSLSIERDTEISVRVEIESTANLEDVEIEAFISGYEYNDRERISDTTHIFDMENATTYVKKLTLSLPYRVDEDAYKLRVIATDRNSDEKIKNYKLKIDVPRHSLTVDDVIFSPEGYVGAGKALLTTVRVSNRGQKSEDGIKVSVAIPELGISASDYIDEVEEEGSGNDDEVTSEELYLRIPVCTKPGTYSVVVEVKYDEGFETITKKSNIEVLEDGACKAGTAAGEGAEGVPQTIINIGSVSQELTAGTGGATYPITVTNGGASSRTYTITTAGLSDWATSAITPTNTIVLGKGETQTIYTYVSAVSGTQAGQRMFSVAISSGDKVLKQIPLTANVVKGAGVASNLKRALEIGLVVLVVLLVILGLIIGFNRLKGTESGSEESQTYY